MSTIYHNGTQVEVKYFNGMAVVRISDKGPGFGKWLYGQTIPYIEGNETPSDWAYYWDFERYVKGLPIID